MEIPTVRASRSTVSAVTHLAAVSAATGALHAQCSLPYRARHAARTQYPVRVTRRSQMKSNGSLPSEDCRAGWTSSTIAKWDQFTEVHRRSDKIRLWRRRALLKRGARLHMAMVASAQASSLAMLDETGTVVCWYGTPDGRDYTSEEVVDRHLSLFYVSEDVMRRQPYRDLRAAVVEGHISRRAWRRRRDGSAFWGTFDIEPVVLRDGRVQGFSCVASPPEGSRSDTG